MNEAVLRGDAEIRPLRRDSEEEIALVAERMRATLVEVLGHERGTGMYTLEWLRARVRWHLEGAARDGEVLVWDEAGRIRGHTIVRMEEEEDGLLGLFSTIYVEPAARRLKIAESLLYRGEDWMRARAATVFATYTAEDNSKLISLFRKRGYDVVDARSGMVRLQRSARKQAE